MTFDGTTTGASPPSGCAPRSTMSSPTTHDHEPEHAAWAAGSRSPTPSLRSSSPASGPSPPGRNATKFGGVAGGQGLGAWRRVGSWYVPSAVRVRKPRRVHSASWVRMLRGLMPSLSASSRPCQGRLGSSFMSAVMISRRVGAAFGLRGLRYRDRQLSSRLGVCRTTSMLAILVGR